MLTLFYSRVCAATLLPLLIAGLAVIPSGQMSAQTFKTLHDFTPTGGPYITNSDGADSFGKLILTNNTLYGTMESGGSSGYGTVFSVHTDGTGFTNLHTFSPRVQGGFGMPATNSDGAYPYAGLVLVGNTLFGTTSAGGAADSGTIYAVQTDGTGFTNLYSFSAMTLGGQGPYGVNYDGAIPTAGLTSSGNVLYGTAWGGGTNGNGTVFAINTDGTGFTNLHSFSVSGDGTLPYEGLILSGATLYGTTSWGSGDIFGSIFSLKTDGTGFTNLYSFTNGPPYGGLVLAGNALYGNMADVIGVDKIFSLNTDGTGFAIRYSFYGDILWSDVGSPGFSPFPGLILSGDTFFDIETTGGFGGTILAVNTNGTGLKYLHKFSSITTNGGILYPEGTSIAGLVLSGRNFYGVTQAGGAGGSGTIFSITLPTSPLLTIKPSGKNVVLTWPTNDTAFVLQSATNLLAPVLWSTNSITPVVVNGNNTVTNPATGKQSFYRLSW